MKRIVTLLTLGIAFAVLSAVAQDGNSHKPSKDMRLIVVDSTGSEMGTVVDFKGGGPDDINGVNAFAVARDGRVAPFHASSELVDTVSQLWYLSADCTGTPFIMTNTQKTLVPRTAFNPPGKSLYIERVSVIGENFVFESNRDEFGSCNQETRSGLGVPATSTGLDFSVFVPPFKVVLASRN